jgi:hypothetical protein
MRRVRPERVKDEHPSSARVARAAPPEENYRACESGRTARRSLLLSSRWQAVVMDQSGGRIVTNKDWREQ